MVADAEAATWRCQVLDVSCWADLRGFQAWRKLVLCIGSNLGLKFGQERPIRVLLPHLAEPKIYK